MARKDRTPPRPREGRRPLIAGNWKMNLTHLEAILLVQKLAATFTEQQLAEVEVAVLPAFTALRSRSSAFCSPRLAARLARTARPKSVTATAATATP